MRQLRARVERLLAEHWAKNGLTPGVAFSCTESAWVNSCGVYNESVQIRLRMDSRVLCEVIAPDAEQAFALLVHRLDNLGVDG